MGLTELTVNSCFFALSSLNFCVFSLLPCVPSHLSFSPLYQKDSKKGVTFKIFYLPSQPDTHSAHAELKLSLFVAYKLIVSH